MQIQFSFHTIATTKHVSSSTESVMMAIMKFSARRLIIAGGFAAAVAAAPAVAVVAMPGPEATPLAQCPSGEAEDLYVGTCIPHTVPNSGAPYQSIGGNPSLAAVDVPGGGGGVPCTGHNSGECIGLAEEAASEGPAAEPRSTVESSPTVTGFEDNAG
jgi:hypothetical protein